MRVFAVIFLMVGVAAAAEPVNIPAKALVPAAVEFDRGTYAAVDFPVAHFVPALKVAEQVAGGALNTRGEAHLTVLTPPEYMRIEPKLRKKILAEMKDALAKDGDVKPVCIGRGQADLNGKTEFTYFVVVDAKAVRAVREKYHLQEFYPHITLGFTKRDLHLEDGVHKDKASCISELAVVP